MKLYHFTPVGNVEAIKAEGIKAQITPEAERMMGYFGGCTFFCNTPTTLIDGRELAMIQRRHPNVKMTAKRWMQWDNAEPLARFTLDIPANYVPPYVRASDSDRFGLKKYGPWLEKRRKAWPTNSKLLDPKDPAMRRAMETWWIGIETTVPPKMIAALDIEDAVPIEATQAMLIDRSKTKR